MQSTLRAFLALVILCWIGAATPSVLRAQPAPPPVSIVSAAGDVRGLIARLDAVAARIKAHRFAPVYYAEPCEPTKQEGEASLAPYRRELRALRAEAERLEAEITALERHAGNKLIMAEHGWDFQNLKRWQPLKGALQNAFAALSAAEARLDAMPVRPCPKPSTPSAQPPVDGPTSADVDLLKDFPVSQPPRFDEPLIPPVPPKSFCSHTERMNWLRNVFWPFYERAKANSVAAITHFNALERRLNEIAYAEGMESPRYKAAERFLKAYAPIKKKHMDFQTEVLKIHDAASNTPVIDCGPPTETGAGGTPPTTPTTPVAPTTPVTPPVTDGPVTPPKPPLPPGVSAPQLERVRIPTLPDKFCSDSEKMAFLVDVYHPAAEAASKNALKTSAYRSLLSNLIYEATVRRDQPTVDALKREYESFKPIAEAADALQLRMMRMRDDILRIPVVDCTKPDQPRTPPPPPTPPAPPPATDGEGLKEIIIDAGRPRPVPPKTPPPPSDLEELIIPGKRITSPAPGDPPPPARPKLPPPNLNRPQFERIREVTPPASFCSEFERNAFLLNIYNPAVAAALANAEKATAHETRLNAMFTEYMRGEGGAGWAAVKKEQAEFKLIADGSRAEATRLQGLYAKIMAVPVKPCPTATATPPPPTTTPVPPATPGPTDGPVIDIFETPAEDIPEIPGTFCDEAERQALRAQLGDIAERLDGRIQKTVDAIRDVRGDLLAAAMRGRAADVAAYEEALANLEARLADLLAQLRRLGDANLRLEAATVKPCPPQTDGPKDGPSTAPQTPQDALPPRMGFKDFEWPPVPSLFCSPAELIAYMNQLKALHAELDEEGRRLYELSRLVAAAQYGSVAPTQGFFDAATLYSPDLAGMLDASRGLFYFSLRARIEDRLDYIDEYLDDIEDELDDLYDALRSRRFDFSCPPPVEDGPVTGPDEAKEPCPPKEGRNPINVGPNNKVGSGAQLRSKVGGMAMGALMGAIGGGGGGGGGGSDGPQLWTCKIKDSEYTVFDDPATGVSLKVGAKRAKGGKVVIFSEIAKSPDKGTFQTAFLENPTTGETQAPNDVGPCDLWGEWKLTVSWTKTTYVDGQVVSRESGGWQKTGKFSIPGTLSKVDAPDGLWKRMGFSNATNGAREMGMIFDVAPGGGPLTFVIHVTRPKGDPVTTVPFVLTMTEGPNGFVFTKAEDPPCPPEPSDAPPESIMDDVDGGPPVLTGGTGVAGATRGPSTATNAGPTTPAGAQPPPSAPYGTPENPVRIGQLSEVVPFPEQYKSAWAEAVGSLDDLRCHGPVVWGAYRDGLLRRLEADFDTLNGYAGAGPADFIVDDGLRELRSFLGGQLTTVRAMTSPGAPGAPSPQAAPAGETCPDAPPESLLDDVEEVPPLLTGGTGVGEVAPSTGSRPPESARPAAPSEGPPESILDDVDEGPPLLTGGTGIASDRPGSVTTTTRPPSAPPATSTTRPPPPAYPQPPPYGPGQDPEAGKLHTAGLQRLVEGLEQMRAEDLVKRQELDRARCEGPKAWNEKREVYLKRLRGRLDIMQRVVGLGRDKSKIEDAAIGETARLGGEIAEVEAMSPPGEPQSCPVTPVPEDGESILDSIEEVFVPA